MFSIHRLDQTLESFEINRDQELWETSTQIVSMSDHNQQLYQVSESESLELANVQSSIKCEVLSCDEDEQIIGHAGGVTTSCHSYSEANVARQIDRLSIDQRSTCSPSTTTPITVCNNIIKKEPPDESKFNIQNAKAAIAMTPMHDEGEMAVLPTTIQRSIPNVENEAIKRGSSDESNDVATKKLKFDPENPLKFIENSEITLNGKYLWKKKFHSDFREKKIIESFGHLNFQTSISPQQILMYCSSIPVSQQPQISIWFHSNKLKLVCFYCQIIAESKNMSMLPFDSIDELKSHFSSKHASERRLFYAVGIACCFYCDKIDTYPRLKNHQSFRHNGKMFVVVDAQNRSECGICHKSYPPNVMEQHFRNVHDPTYLVGIFNPVCITQYEIEQLFNIRTCENVEKSVTKLQKFICGHCNAELHPTKSSFKNHFENTTFKFQCSRCEFIADDFENLIDHETNQHSIDVREKHLIALKARLKKYYYRTRLIFTNDLVLFNHNVLSTSFDFRKEFFGSFINGFVNLKFAKQKTDRTKEITNDEPILISNPPSKCERALRNLQEIELRNQREYRNNLCISGVRCVGKEELPRIFMNICCAIGANVSLDDIESIFQRSEYDIIVKLKKWDIKKEILKKWEQNDADQFTDKLRSLSFMQQKLQSVTLKIRNDMTPFFQDLWEVADTARMNKQIFSFWISWYGLTVKITSCSKPKVIWSKLDLHSD